MNFFDAIPWTDLVSASQWCTHILLAVTIEIPHLRSHSMTKVVGKFQLTKLHRSSLLCISHMSALPQFTILKFFLAQWHTALMSKQSAPSTTYIHQWISVGETPVVARNSSTACCLSVPTSTQYRLPFHMQQQHKFLTQPLAAHQCCHLLTRYKVWGTTFHLPLIHGLIQDDISLPTVVTYIINTAH